MPNLLTDPWWTWTPETAGPGDYLYRGFNLFEAGCWFVFAGLVIRRWGRCRRSNWEVLYALSFAAFGLTDVAEAYQQTAGLLGIKGLVLAALVVLRAYIRRCCYPGSRIY
jgi:hypothetical protein